jgi:hypothetical protein
MIDNPYRNTNNSNTLLNRTRMEELKDWHRYIRNSDFWKKLNKEGV